MTEATTGAERRRLAGRRGARYGAVQALYRWLMNPVSSPEVLAETVQWEHLATANRQMLEELVRATIADHAALDEQLAAFLDRPVDQLDPMEHAILLIAALELRESLSLSHRVVINEAVELCKLFGGSESHRYVNGVLDRLARQLRPLEFNG